MACPHDETIERQAYTTRLLLDHVHAPVVPAVFLCGVLPKRTQCGS
ncbi:hypothetical protein OH768_51905 [Streptomyces sp. NBC_01622]|nr:hypothetical protein OH768_51905 [Streptomyces sp. NBC_01622]